MSDIVSEVQVPQVQESPDRMTNALAALDKAQEADEVVQQAPEAQEHAVPETQAQQPADVDRADLWSKLAARDKEIRTLKQSAKTDLREMVKTDPHGVLRELGLSLDQVFDLMTRTPAVEKQEPEPENRSDSEVSRLRQELEEYKAEQAQRTHQEAVRNEHLKIMRIAESDTDRWELIASMVGEGSTELVLETAKESYKNTGELPDYDVVMDAVEEHMNEELGSRYEKLNSLKKIQNKFSMGKQKSKAEQLIDMPTAAAPTLSTGMSGGPSPRGLTEQERMAKALALLDQKGD
jgi:hypothetical protein